MDTPQLLHKSISDTSRRRPIWDCGSSLYDSFELRSFHNHLHSAIAGPSAVPRTFSMPHAPTRCPPSRPQNNTRAKIPRALQKLFRSVFRRKRDYSENGNATFEGEKEGLVKEVQEAPKERYYYVFYDKSGALSAIPEVPEFDAPPKRQNFVRRTASAS